MSPHSCITRAISGAKQAVCRGKGPGIPPGPPPPRGPGGGGGGKPPTASYYSTLSPESCQRRLFPSGALVQVCYGKPRGEKNGSGGGSGGQGGGSVMGPSLPPSLKPDWHVAGLSVELEDESVLVKWSVPRGATGSYEVVRLDDDSSYESTILAGTLHGGRMMQVTDSPATRDSRYKLVLKDDLGRGQVVGPIDIRDRTLKTAIGKSETREVMLGQVGRDGLGTGRSWGAFWMLALLSFGVLLHRRF